MHYAILNKIVGNIELMHKIDGVLFNYSIYKVISLVGFIWPMNKLYGLLGNCDISGGIKYDKENGRVTVGYLVFNYK